MELDFFVSRSHEMVDNMRRRGVAAGAAKPFATCKAFNHAARVVNSTISVADNKS